MRVFRLNEFDLPYQSVKSVDMRAKLHVQPEMLNGQRKIFYGHSSF